MIKKLVLGMLILLFFPLGVWANEESYLKKAIEHVEKGGDINIRNMFGQTPLHFAAFLGYGKVVEFLLSKGADINAKDENGWTPLHLAVKYGHKRVAEYLLSKGADVNARTTRNTEGWKDILAGSTPLDLANLFGKQEMVEILLLWGGKRGESLSQKQEREKSP